MAYLKTDLAPLGSVWDEELPAETILKDCATTIEALLPNLDADKTLEARLDVLNTFFTYYVLTQSRK